MHPEQGHAGGGGAIRISAWLRGSSIQSTWVTPGGFGRLDPLDGHSFGVAVGRPGRRSGGRLAGPDGLDAGDAPAVVGPLEAVGLALVAVGIDRLDDDPRRRPGRRARRRRRHGSCAASAARRRASAKASRPASSASRSIRERSGSARRRGSRRRRRAGRRPGASGGGIRASPDGSVVREPWPCPSATDGTARRRSRGSGPSGRTVSMPGENAGFMAGSPLSSAAVASSAKRLRSTSWPGSTTTLRSNFGSSSARARGRAGAGWRRGPCGPRRGPW